MDSIPVRARSRSSEQRTVPAFDRWGITPRRSNERALYVDSSSNRAHCGHVVAGVRWAAGRRTRHRRPTTASRYPSSRTIACRAACNPAREAHTIPLAHGLTVPLRCLAHRLRRTAPLRSPAPRNQLLGTRCSHFSIDCWKAFSAGSKPRPCRSTRRALRALQIKESTTRLPLVQWALMTRQTPYIRRGRLTHFSQTGSHHQARQTSDLDVCRTSWTVRTL